MPSRLSAHPIEYATSGDAVVDDVLNAKTEIYSDEQKRSIDNAVVTALQPTPRRTGR